MASLQYGSFSRTREWQLFAHFLRRRQKILRRNVDITETFFHMSDEKCNASFGIGLNQNFPVPKTVEHAAHKNGIQGSDAVLDLSRSDDASNLCALAVPCDYGA